MTDNSDGHEVHEVRPYGNLGGSFYLDKRTYRFYRAYTAVATTILLVVGAWLLSHDDLPRDTWPSVWVAIAIVAYGQYRIVNSGRREIANAKPQRPQRGYSALRFWPVLITGCFLLAFTSLSLWADITRNHEVHAYEFDLLLVAAIGFWAASMERRRKSAKDNIRRRSQIAARKPGATSRENSAMFSSARVSGMLPKVKRPIR